MLRTGVLTWHLEMPGVAPEEAKVDAAASASRRLMKLRSSISPAVRYTCPHRHLSYCS